MIICFDVGNTDIVAGVFCDGELSHLTRFRYVKSLKESEYLPFLLEKMRIAHIDCHKITGCVLCCVAQNTADSLCLAMEAAFGVTPILFKNDENCRIEVKTGDPQEVGVDIMAACMAAKSKYAMPCIVIDMGTATTVTAMDSSAQLCGVSIIPGVFTSMWALRDRTGLNVDETLKSPLKAIGTTTSESLASGIVLGSAFCLDGMIEAFEKELGEKCSIAATGGGAQFIVPHCKRDVVLNNNLLLEGLYEYYKNTIINQ